MKKEFMMSKITPFTEEELLRFQKGVETVSSYGKGMQGIGSFQEKSVHAILKHYIAPNRDHQEVAIESYVADAVIDGEVYEIQSKDFYRMKGKLDCFLKAYEVTIVYPVILEKTIRWIDPETGEISEGKKSPKHGNLYTVFEELYGIKEFLNKRKLHVMMIFIYAEEYKLLDGFGKDKKLHATKTDRVPVHFVGTYLLDKKKDYEKLLPGGLPLQFTTKDIQSITKCTLEEARVFLNILAMKSVVTEVGRKGHYKLYQKGNFNLLE